jgi:hypothetical protein
VRVHKARRPLTHCQASARRNPWQVTMTYLKNEGRCSGKQGSLRTQSRRTMNLCGRSTRRRE